jgi:hypothetical protein
MKVPNKIILISIDALRYDASRIIWPYFNIVFTQHYTSNNWTLPTTARLLTGKLDTGFSYLKKMKIENIYDDLKNKLKVPTIGKHLLDNDWITYAKTEGLYLSTAFGFGKIPDAWTLFECEEPTADGSKLGEPLFIDDKKEFRFYHDYYVHHYFQDAGIEKKEKLKNVIPGKDLDVFMFGGSREDIIKSEKAYAKRCHGLINLLSWIPKSDAIVIVTADHGESFFEYYGDFSHTESHMVEEIAHVPLLIHWPGMKGQRIGMFTRDIDVAPTILDLAGVKDVKLDGRSLVEVITKGRRWSSVYEDYYVHRNNEIWKFRFTPTEKSISFVKELDEKEKAK